MAFQTIATADQYLLKLFKVNKQEDGENCIRRSFTIGTPT
jgi:hypothetical protein